MSRQNEPDPDYYETAKRPPTEADGIYGVVLAYGDGKIAPKEWSPISIIRIVNAPTTWSYWMPMPPAPVLSKTECERAFEMRLRQLRDIGVSLAQEELAWNDFRAGWEARKEQL